jgi:L-asparaginase II
MSEHQKLVEVTRNEIVESEHFGSIVLNTRGFGQADALMYPRSTLKLFQAVSVLSLGVELTSEEIAIAAASHSAESIHLEVVQGLLKKFKLSVDNLRCTPRLPLGTEARHDAIRNGIAENTLMSDCSGKHASFLAACVVNQWPLENYLEFDHPLQIAITKNIESWLGITITRRGVDGCGAPVVAMSLFDLATGFLSAVREPGHLGTVASAMSKHPELVGGKKRLATEVMTGVPGAIAKDGAEGVFVVAHRDLGVLAIKVSDGSTRPHASIVKHVLTNWAVSAEIPISQPLGGGQEVGQIRLTKDLIDFLG